MLSRERRDLNAAVRAYLAAAGYKLAALTFAEEAGVGAAAANPGPGSCPALPDLLRRDAEREGALAEAAAARADREAMAGELAAARARVAELQARAAPAVHCFRWCPPMGLGHVTQGSIETNITSNAHGKAQQQARDSSQSQWVEPLHGAGVDGCADAGGQPAARGRGVRAAQAGLAGRSGGGRRGARARR